MGKNPLSNIFFLKKKKKKAKAHVGVGEVQLCGILFEKLFMYCLLILYIPLIYH